MAQARLRLRSVRDRRRLRRRALRAHRGRAWRQGRHRGRALLGRHLRQCRLRAEEADGAGRRLRHGGGGREGFGWHAERGTHDWRAFIATKDREIARLNGIYVKLLTGAGVEIHEARASFIDAHTLDVGGKRVTAERIVIATGGPPDQARHPGRRARHHLGRGVPSARHAEARRARRRRLYLGRVRRHLRRPRRRGDARAAASACRCAASTTTCARRSARRCTRRASASTPRSRPPRSRMTQTGKCMTLSDGETIDTDLVFFATGRVPNTRGLGLENAGVVTQPRSARSRSMQGSARTCRTSSPSAT